MLKMEENSSPDQREQLSSWLADVIKVYTSLNDENKNFVLDTLITNSEPSQLHFLSTHLPDLLLRDFLSYLPQEIVVIVLQFLDGRELLKCCEVCKSWKRRIDSLPNVWAVKATERGVNVKAISVDTEDRDAQTSCSLPLTLSLKRKKKARLYKTAYCCAEKFISGLKKLDDSSLRIVQDYVETGKNVEHFCYSDGTLFTGHSDCIKVWSLSDGSLQKIVNTPRIMPLLFKDPLLFTASFDSCVQCWDVAMGTRLFVLVGHVSVVIAMDVDKDFAITGSVDKSIKVWDIGRRENPQLLMTLDNMHSEWISKVSFRQQMKDGELRFISCDSKGVFSWNFDIHTRHVESSHCALLEDNFELVSCCTECGCAEDTDTIFTSQWSFKAKRSWLASYSMEKDTTIVLKRSWPIPMRGVKAYLLGVGRRFALFFCSIFSHDFHLFDLSSGSCLVTISTPSFQFGKFRSEQAIALCDTSWLDGFVFGQMARDKLVFAACGSSTTVTVGRWNVPEMEEETEDSD